ncbi:rhomboid family intramembrane serine protease [Bacillus sp. REN10]|uniref:rhomboid family intramembrane serine protease n=1 Tax=Bacillus sp. REN10 TaxID=2782541 RepID=UPI00193B2B30|nr:rhomboid family intramembrane serine protease [Bacillus sp. REN10]
MGSNENNLFWKLAYFFVVEKDYQIMSMADHRQEILLENITNKSAQLIRLIRADVGWSNHLRKDIERVSAIGEGIRKRLGKRSLNVVNIYISSHSPIDDYEKYVKDPFYYPQGQKTKVTSILFSQDRHRETINQLNPLFQEAIVSSFFDSCSDEEAYAYHRAVLAYSVKKKQEDQKLFNYATPFFSFLFIGIQVIVFMLMELTGGSTNSSNLIRFGAKFNPLIFEGEWWRFFTPMFLHIGFLHLLMNTAALYLLGTAVEKIFGRLRFLFIYLFAGFTGTLASFLMNDSLSAGASGAIFGCFGALLYFGTVYPRQFFRTMGMNIIFIIIINLVFGFTMPGIDNAGHIGGLIGGFLAAGVAHLPTNSQAGRQLVFLAGTMMITAGALYVGFN